jgi:hypothetical protein
MILGIAATGLVAALSMSETASAQGSGGGCGSGGCGGDILCCATPYNGGHGFGGSNSGSGAALDSARTISTTQIS